MPTLFISYKRGTTAIAPLMNHLRAAKYRLWFDRDEIHLGDPDWQARIDRGLENSQGMILGITPAACDSEPIRYEVRKARDLNVPIFPVILERLTDYDEVIRKLGLPDKQHIEDFTDADRWEENCERLLRDLRMQGLTVTRHDERAQRGEAAYTLHQRYLKRLVEQAGRLQLSQINADQPDGVLLEQIYVDPPTPLSISVEVLDWQIVDWWISRDGEGRTRPGDEAQPETRATPADMGYEADALESLIETIEQRIATHREENPHAKPDDENRWLNPWKNGSRENVLTLNVQDIAAARDRLVILGAPGSGKSTFVRHLALCLAGAQIDGWDRAADLSTLGQWPHGPLTPVYVELRRFVASKHFPARINDQPNVDHLWQYIEADILGNDLADYAADLKQDLEQGHAVLILDGLDEVPYPEDHLADRQRQLQSLATSINTVYRPSRVIVASRPYAYESWTLPGFEAVTLADFEDKHRIALAANLYRAAGQPDEESKARANRLNTQLGPIDPQLKDRPLFLTLMAIIFMDGEEEGLPTRKGALYRQSIMLLLDRWTQSKPDAPALTDLLGEKTPHDLYVRLAALAYDVHSSCRDRSETPEIEEALLYRYLKPMGRHVAADLIPYLSENAGVLVSPGQDYQRDVFHFAHRSFQEYLAGAHLVAESAAAESFERIRDHVRAQPQIWREPCRLAGDVLADTGRASDLWDLISDLLAEELPDALPADSPDWWAVWLAGQIAVEQDLHRITKLGRRERPVRDALIDWLVLLVNTPQALLPGERTQCGRVLGWFGDPRPGVLAPGGIPDIDWVEIPAGEFLMGSDKEIDSQAYDDELPQHTVRLDAFAISRYSITYAQYAAFVEGDGYTNRVYWTDAGWDDKGERTEPRYWNDPQWHIDNHPVVGVTWYEAFAFTRWLSARLGVGVSLLTESQWERAARGTDGRTYPYGNEFDPTKGNTSDTGIESTSAVGMFPDGASPDGVLDMSGNVYDWCLTQWRNSYSETPDDDPEGDARRVVRGGSWYYDLSVARAAFRGGGLPNFRGLSVGFRVVRVPHL